MEKFIVVGGNHPEIIQSALIRKSYIQSKEDIDTLDDIAIYWKSTPFNILQLCKIDKANCNRPIPIYINHIDYMKTLCTKTGLLNSLLLYYKKNEVKHCHIFDSVPTSYIAVTDTENSSFSAFVEKFKDLECGNFTKERMPSKHCEQNVWLIKPACLNQGRGIEIFTSLQWIKKFISKKPIHSCLLYTSPSPRDS